MRHPNFASLIALAVASSAVGAAAFQASTSHGVSGVISPQFGIGRSFSQGARPHPTTPSLRHHNLSSLQMTSSIAESRQQRIATGHQLSSLLFAATSATIIYNGISAPVGLALPFYAASGPLLAAGVSRILAGAAKAGRLGSDTYKRLNLVQAKYDLCGLSTIFLAPGGTSLREHIFYLLSAASFLSLSPSISGWIFGEKGLDAEKGSGDSVVTYLLDGAKNTLKGVTSFGNAKGAIYLAGTYLVGTLKLMKLVEMAKLVASGTSPSMFATRAVRLGRLSLLTAVMYTLKDAADRDRLEGTTFIELNFLSSAVLGCMANYIRNMSGSVTPLFGAASFFSVFTLFNALASIAKKRNKAEDDSAAVEVNPAAEIGKINSQIELDSPKVVNNEKLDIGSKGVFCRCWKSSTFPLCDASHVKHNEATGDNVGPLIISVPKPKVVDPVAKIGKINSQIDLDSPKVVNNEKLDIGSKGVFCRCWKSGTFPLCDASHVKHNEATGDNVGPLIIGVPKPKAEE